MRMTNPKLVRSSCVKTEVCVRKPGPIAEVAMRKAAPSIALLAAALEERVLDGFKKADLVYATQGQNRLFISIPFILNSSFILFAN